MPRMPGLQVADPGVQSQLGTEDKRGIARSLHDAQLVCDLTKEVSYEALGLTSVCLTSV